MLGVRRWKVVCLRVFLQANASFLLLPVGCWVVLALALSFSLSIQLAPTQYAVLAFFPLLGISLWSVEMEELRPSASSEYFYMYYTVVEVR